MPSPYDFQRDQEVRPDDWRNPQPTGRYNLVVIGGGTAGLVAAAGAATLGAKVALIERARLGGDCLNVGCVPSKGMIRSARAIAEVRRSVEFGVRGAEGATIDFAAAAERMRRLRARISHHDSARRFRDLGVDVYFGDARFVGSDRVAIKGTELTFSRAILATGTRPRIPSIPGLDQIHVLTNENVFDLEALPARLGVIGAGPIGCELAQTLRRFGSEVVLYQSERILPKDDSDAAEIVRQALLRDGVRILGGGKRLQVQRVDLGARVTTPDAEDPELFDRLLLAVGREPNVDGMGLEAAGVERDDQGVKVDDRLQTTNSNIYAAGDVCSKFRFTHAADFMARLAIQNALFFGRRRMSSLVIPWCTYTSPELAQVGLTEDDARRRGLEYDVFVQPMREVDRAILDGEVEGFVKVLAKKGGDQILGATIVAERAGEMIGEITLAMTHGLGLKQLGSVIHPYPTQTEVVRKVGDAYNRTRLKPLVRRVLDSWLTWRR